MCVRRLWIAALSVSNPWVHHIVPLVNKLGHSRFGSLAARLGLLDAEDCGSAVVAAAGALRGRPLRGGSAVAVFDMSITAALHCLVATRSTLLPN